MIHSLEDAINHFITLLLRAVPPAVGVFIFTVRTDIYELSHTFTDVAEDNIKATCLESTDIHRIFTEAQAAGRYFEDLTQVDGRARFFLSPELNAAYPDDEAFGEKWLKQGDQ